MKENPEEIDLAKIDLKRQVEAQAATIERLTAELATANATIEAAGLVAVPDDLAALVKEKMKAGLPKDVAIECAKKQFEHNKRLAQSSVVKTIEAIIPPDAPAPKEDEQPKRRGGRRKVEDAPAPTEESPQT